MTSECITKQFKEAILVNYQDIKFVDGQPYLKRKYRKYKREVFKLTNKLQK